MRLIHSSELPSGNRSAEVQAGLTLISEPRLREWVEMISMPRHFQAQPADNESTARWVATQLTDWGYDVELQGQYHNVVAWPKKCSREMAVVGAHYDSVPETPGADDNGSAVAALLGCAEAVARFAPQAAVGFVAFNCEEDGMAGSIDFVENHLPTMDFKVTQAHILEMVGFASHEAGSQKLPTGLPIQIPDRGDFLGLLANPDSGGMMDSILGQARTYLPDFKVLGLEVGAGAERAFPVLGRSDHVAFWRRGIPAVMWTDTAEFRNPNYHRPTDTPETLNYGFLLLVTRLLAACLGEKDGRRA